MDIGSLEGQVQKYFEAGLAPSTKKTYHAGIAKFNQFCITYNITAPLPASQFILCGFITYLAEHNLSYATIKTYLSAVRYLHLCNGMPDPRALPTPRLDLVSRGIRCAKALQESSRPRLPITPPILRQIRALWSRSADSFDTIMLWAASTLCFFGFFRVGEITSPSDRGFNPQHHLSFCDVAVDNLSAPSVLQVHLKQSKTDQFRRGIDVYIGKTGDDLCPVAAVLAYLAARRGSPGALFRFQDGRLLTPMRFTEKLREALEALGLQSEHYAGHSFRIGAATTAAERGLEDSLIKALGRWESTAYLLYVRTPRERLASISGLLSRQ